MRRNTTTQVRRVRPGEFVETTQPPATMPQTGNFVPAIRERTAVAPNAPTAVDPYAAYAPQPAQFVARYEYTPESRARAMLVRTSAVTLALAVLTMAGMAMLGTWGFFLWLLLASLEWVGCFVVVAVLDYREQPMSLSRHMGNRYMDMMEREQAARLRYQYGDTMTIATKTFDRFVERAALEIGAYGNHRTSHDLVDAETIVAARCQLVNGEIEQFTRFCYQCEGSWLVNLSGNTQIPTGVWSPWGSSGRGRLTRVERDTVRVWLRALGRQRGPKPLYFYNTAARRWHVDTVRYSTLETALQWVANHQLDAKLWLSIQARLRGHE